MSKADKIIQKILDRYYTRKLVEEVRAHIFSYWFVDIREQHETRNTVSLYVKNIKYNDGEYKHLITFSTHNSIMNLIQLKELKKNIDARIEMYHKNY